MQSIISTLLVIPSRFNGNSHTSNIIIGCFIPPTESVMPKPFSSTNASHVSSPPPMVLSERRSAQQDNVFSTHYLLYWFNLLEASWPWIRTVAVASAVWQHPQLHAGIVGYPKQAFEFLTLEAAIHHFVIHHSWEKPWDCCELCCVIVVSQGYSMGRIWLEINALPSFFFLCPSTLPAASNWC